MKIFPDVPKLLLDKIKLKRYTIIEIIILTRYNYRKEIAYE